MHDINTHRFGVPERFLWLLNPELRLRIVRQHPPFWPILARFMDYYSCYWGTEAILKVEEPQDALMCQSSTVTVLPDSGRFMGYYTVLGSLCDTMVVELQGAITCRSSILASLSDSAHLMGYCSPFEVLERFPQ